MRSVRSLFHPQEFGDYLIWRLWPQQKTVVDGRVHLFSLEFLKQYERALEDPLSSDFLGKWKVDYLLLSKLPDGSNAKTIGSIRSSNAWAPLSADSARGIIYIPVGTPSNDYYGGERPGAGLFGESIVPSKSRWAISPGMSSAGARLGRSDAWGDPPPSGD